MIRPSNIRCAESEAEGVGSGGRLEITVGRSPTMGMGFGVGESGIGVRAESDAGFDADPVIRVLEFVAPMILRRTGFQPVKIVGQVFYLSSEMRPLFS